MALNYYGQLYVLVNGQLLAEATGVEGGDQDDGQPVKTIVKKLAGKTPGPHTTTMSIRNVVPAAGVEIEFHNMAVNDEFVQVKLQREDGKSLTSDGWFMSPTSASGVGESMSYNVEFMGTAAEWV